MAEGLLRAWGGDRYTVRSAGTEPTTVRTEAIAVMREIGIDIGDHTSETIDRFADEPWDWLITVCDQAAESCPTLPGVHHQEHWSIPDPSAVEGDEAVRLDAFRTTREDLATRILMFLQSPSG